MPLAPNYSWSARAAYAAAALFFLSSAATNVIYGWGKGESIPSSLVWAAVSLGVSLVFSLCFPALIQSCERAQWARAGIIALAMALTGSYSVAAALGSATSGRTNAATEERVITEARSKTQTAYDLASAELQKLPDVRPAGELRALIEAAQREKSELPTTRSVSQLQSLIDSARSSPQAAECAAANSPNRAVCQRLSQWRAELARSAQRRKLEQDIADLSADLARAEQRTRLKTELDAASAKLERIGAPKLANSDAVALSAYLIGLGVPVEPEKLNKILVLLTVLMLELGGGLALTVGMALSATQGTSASTRNSQIGSSSAAEVSIAVASPTEAAAIAEAPGQYRFLEFLRAHGGHIQEGQRALGRKLGMSKTQTNRLIKDLVGADLIAAAPGPKGTNIRLK